MTDLVEHVTPPAPSFQAETHELDGDLSKMASDLAKIAVGVGKVRAGDKAQIKPGFSYDYAGLPSVVDALKPTLSSLEIGLLQVPLVTPKGAGCVTHVLGQGWRITCTVLFGMGQASPQAIGSLQTYARRYSLLGIFSLAPGDDDGKGDMAEEAHRKQRGQQMQQRDNAEGRGAAAANPQVIIDAFRKFSVSEGALVAQLEGTPLAKVDPAQKRELRTLLLRLQADESVEDVLGAAALEVVLNGDALGEKRRTIETKAKIHTDAQAQPAEGMFPGEEPAGGYGADA